MKHSMTIILLFVFKLTVAQDTLSISVERENQLIYLNADITDSQTYISSQNNSKWIIEKYPGYVEIKNMRKQYLYYSKIDNEVRVSDNQKTKWKLTELGGLTFYIQPADEKGLYLSVYGSEIKLLPYNPDLTQTIYQKWILNGW